MSNHRNDSNGTLLTQNSSGNSLPPVFSALLVWLHSQPCDFIFAALLSESQQESNATSKFQILYILKPPSLNSFLQQNTVK